MNRRDWLKRTSLALAGGLVLGDAAMEAFERLTHRKVFAMWKPRDMLYQERWVEFNTGRQWITFTKYGRVLCRFPLPVASDTDYIFLANT